MGDVIVMGDMDKPAFPWGFLSDPDGSDRDLAAVWIFLNLRAKAYKGFLETGPGILVGPFLSDENEIPITSEQAIRRHANDQVVGISVMYLPARSSGFVKAIPDETLRDEILIALAQYDPRTQCVVLLRHDETALCVRIIGVAAAPSNQNAPQAAYFREVLTQAADGGLPN